MADTLTAFADRAWNFHRIPAGTDDPENFPLACDPRPLE
jgi:hypothetical protein